MKKFKTWLLFVLIFGALINAVWLFLSNVGGQPIFEYTGVLVGWFWISVICLFAIKTD